MWNLLALPFVKGEETGTLSGLCFSQGRTAEGWQAGIKIQDSPLSKINEGQDPN